MTSGAYPAGELCSSARRPQGRRKYPGPWGSGPKPIHPFAQTSSYRQHRGRTAPQRRTATWPEDLKAPTGDGQMAVKMDQPSGRPNRRYRRSCPTRIAGQTCHSPVGERERLGGNNIAAGFCVRRFRSASTGTWTSQRGVSTHGAHNHDADRTQLLSASSG